MADFAPWERKRIEAAEEFFKKGELLAMGSFQLAYRVLWLADQAVPVVPVEGVERVDEGQRPQRQDSLTDQLRIVRVAANRLGCCDAADFIGRHLEGV